MNVRWTQETQINANVHLSNGLCTHLIWKTSINTHKNKRRIHIHSNTHIQSRARASVLTHTLRANSVCLFRVYLTRCHENAALCSWLLISSINSPPLLPIHPSPPLSSPPLPSPLPPPCPRWPPWLRGYLLLWQPLAGGNQPRCLRAGTTLWQLWGREINNREQRGLLLLLLYFSTSTEESGAPWERKSPLSNISKHRSLSWRSNTTSQQTSVLWDKLTVTAQSALCKPQHHLLFRVAWEALVESAKAVQMSGLLLHPEIWALPLIQIDFLNMQTYPKDLKEHLYLSYGLKNDYHLTVETRDPDHRRNVISCSWAWSLSAQANWMEIYS